MSAVATILIPIAAVLITAAVSLQIATKQNRATATQMHRSECIEGYHHILASYDAIWYWNLRSALRSLPKETDVLEPLKKSWLRESERVGQKGLDLLRSHSPDFEAASRAILHFEMIVNGDISTNSFEQIELARQLVVDHQRADTALDEEILRKNTRNWAKKVHAKRESLRKPPIAFEQIQKEAQAAGTGFFVSQDNDALVEWLEALGKLNEERERSLATMEGRLYEWISKGIWRIELPETST